MFKLMAAGLPWAGYVRSLLGGLVKNERGQDLLEYAILGGAIAAAIIGALFLWEDSLNAMAENIGACIDFDGTTDCEPGF